MKRYSFDRKGVYTPCISRKKRISKTPSFVFNHLCTKSTKRMHNDILAAETMEDAASDDTNCMVLLCVANVLILRHT